MAEPDWTLIHETLKQLQADSADFKDSFRLMLKEMGELRQQQSELREEVTYALGLIVATQRDTNRAKARMDEVVARIEKVEAH